MILEASFNNNQCLFVRQKLISISIYCESNNAGEFVQINSSKVDHLKSINITPSHCYFQTKIDCSKKCWILLESLTVSSSSSLKVSIQ